MFTILIIVAILLASIAGIAIYFGFCAIRDSEKGKIIAWSIGFLVCIILIIACIIWAFSTPGGKMALAKFKVTTSEQDWLVIDRSGGKTCAHWIIEGIVSDSKMSDGWQFYDKDENLIFVSGDAIVIHIKHLDSFKKDYKKRFDIPKSQEPNN